MPADDRLTFRDKIYELRGYLYLFYKLPLGQV